MNMYMFFYNLKCHKISFKWEVSEVQHLLNEFQHWAANQHIRMISERCDTEDGSNYMNKLPFNTNQNRKQLY